MIYVAILWFITFMEHSDYPTRKPPQPYTLSMFVVCACFFDIIAWCAKDSIFVCWKGKNLPISSVADVAFDDNKTEVTSLNNFDDESDDNIIDVEDKDSVDDNPYNFPANNLMNFKAGSQLIPSHRSSRNKNKPMARPVTARTQLLEEKYNKDNKKTKAKLINSYNVIFK